MGARAVRHQTRTFVGYRWAKLSQQTGRSPGFHRLGGEATMTVDPKATVAAFAGRNGCALALRVMIWVAVELHDSGFCGVLTSDRSDRIGTRLIEALRHCDCLSGQRFA